MAKITLADIASPNLSGITAINNNNQLIENAIENTLSRDGTTPNEMNADLDMNSNQILNLPEPIELTEPVRLQEFELLEITLTNLAQDAADSAAAAEAAAQAALAKVADGDHGDITISGTTFTIDNDAVSLADLPPANASTLIGRRSGSSGDLEEITLGTNISMSGTILNVPALQVPDGDKGDITVSGGGTSWQIDANAVGTPEIADSAVTTLKINDLAVTTGKINDLAVTSGKLASSAVIEAKIADDAVTFPKIQNITENKLLGRGNTVAGNMEEITLGTSLSMSGSTLNATFSGANTSFSTIAVSGQSDVVADLATDTLTLVAGSGMTLTTNAGTDTITFASNVTNGDRGDITVFDNGATWLIDNNVVTYAKIQDVTTNRFLGRITAGSGDTEELTGTQATTLLDTFTSTLKGLVPLSGGGTTNFLRADGAWAAPPGGGGGGTPGGADTQVQFNDGGAFGGDDALVWDKTNNVLRAGGRVLLASSGTPFTGAGEPYLQLFGTGGTTETIERSSITGINFGNHLQSANWSLKKSRSGVAGSFAVVSSGDFLGRLGFYGDDGDQFLAGAAIEAAVDGTPGNNDMPGRLMFGTTSDGGTFYIERMRIDSAGRVVIAENGGNITGDHFQVANTGGLNAGYSRFAANAFGPEFTFYKSRHATLGSHTVLQSGDEVGFIVFKGSDGTNFETAATIEAYIDGTPGDNDMPGRLAFRTSPDGGITPVERMRIHSTGIVNIGDHTNSSGKLFINWNADALVDNFTTRFQMVAPPNSDWMQTFIAIGAVNSAAEIAAHKTRATDPTVHTDLVNNDRIFGLRAYGSMGGDHRQAGTMFFRARDLSGTLPATVVPGEWYLTLSNTSGTDTAVLNATSQGGGQGQGGGLLVGGFFNGTTASRTLVARHLDGTTNTVVPVFQIWRDSTTTPAAGIGASLEFNVETSADNHEIGATIAAVTTDVTSTSEDFDLSFSVMAAGATASEKIRIRSTGVIAMNGFDTTWSDAGFDVLYGWDDSGSTYKSMLLADIATEATPAAGDFLLMYGAEGDLRKVNWSSLPGGGGGTPGGSDGQVQYNNGGAFGGAAAHWWDDGNNRMSLATSIVDYPARLTVAGVDGETSQIAIGEFANDALTGNIHFLKSRNTTLGSHTIVQSGDGVGTINFLASDGAAFQHVATISGVVDGTPGTDEVPGRLVFNTTPDGTNTPVERLRITNVGNVWVEGGAGVMGSGGDDSRLGIAHNGPGSLFSFSINKYGGTATGPYIGYIATRGTSPTNHVTLNTGDSVLNEEYYGSDGGNYRLTHTHRAQVTVGGTNDIGGSFTWSARNPGVGELVTPRFRINDTPGLTEVLDRSTLTNTVRRILRLHHETSGTPAAGIGAGIEFNIEAAAGMEIGAAIEALATDVTDTSEDFDLRFLTMGAGATAAERMRITSTGRLLVNHTTSISGAAGEARMQVHDFSGSNGLADFFGWTNGSTLGPMISTHMSRSGTFGTHQIVADDDQIGRITFRGSDGDQFLAAARIDAFIDGTPADNVMPGRLVFSVNSGGTGATERMRIDNDGYTTIDRAGGGDQPTISNFNSTLVITNSDLDEWSLGIISFKDTAGGSNIQFAKTRNASPRAHTVVNSGDTIGTLAFKGSDGDQFVIAARIDAVVDGTPGDNDMPGRLVFSMTADGASSVTERLRIKSDGTWTVNNNSEGIVWSDAGFDVLFGWDDSADTYKSLLLADIATEGAPAAGDFVILYGAEGDLRKVNWSSLPGVGGGINNVVEDTTPELGGDLESNNFDIIMEQFSADNVGSQINFHKSRNASIGSHTVVNNGDNIALLRFYGSDGDQFVEAARITAFIGGAPGDNDMPGSLEFAVTPDGGTAVATALTIASTGRGTFSAGTDYQFIADGSVVNSANPAGFRLKNGGWEIGFRTNPSNGWFEVTSNSNAIQHRWQAKDYLLASDGALGWSSEGDFATSGVGARDISVGRNGAGQLLVTGTTALTNTVNPALRLIHATTGTPATGIGQSIEFQQETADGNFEIGASIVALTTDVGAGTEDFDLSFRLMAAGAAVVERMKIDSGGQVTVDRIGRSGGWNIRSIGGSDFWLSANSDSVVLYGSTDRIALPSDHVFSWANTTDPSSGGDDVILSRLAAGQLRYEAITTQTNAVSNILRLRHTTTGTAATGIGSSIEFEQDTGSDNYEVGASISAVTTDVTSTSEDFDLRFHTMSAGAAAVQRLSVGSSVAVNVSGTFTVGQEIGGGGSPSSITVNPNAGTISITGGNGTVAVTSNLGAQVNVRDEVHVTGGRLIESEVILTDGANVTLNSNLGNTFKLTAGGNRTIDAPTNKPSSGEVQKIVIAVEASGADRTITLATGSAGAFRFGTDITGLTATTNGLVDYIGCIYNDADDRWDVVSYVKGY